MYLTFNGETVKSARSDDTFSEFTYESGYTQSVKLTEQSNNVLHIPFVLVVVVVVNLTVST